MVFAAAAAATVAVPASALAGPRAGARYDGTSATSKPVFLEVRQDGRRLGNWEVATRVPCSDGKRHLVGFGSKGERPVTIAPDGTFSFSSPQRRSGQATFKGAFDSSGNRVTGSFNVALKDRHVSCQTGEVTYAMSRDGTPGAPYRDSRVASGLYVASGRSLSLTLRPLLPGQLIHSLHVRYRLRCRSGATRRGFDVLSPLALNRRGAFAGGAAGPLNGRSVVVRHQFQIEGAFRYLRGAYRLGGAIQVRNVIRRRGGSTDVCKGKIPFVGSFKRGPLGEEGPHPAG
jgi:hypothetical protein